MPTNTNVTNLKINTLTESQFDTAVQQGVIGANEISILTDVNDAIQVDTLPTAAASEEGKIYQFVGTTDANYTNGYFYKCTASPATATCEQTYGSGLTDISVTNTSTFESTFCSAFDVSAMSGTTAVDLSALTTISGSQGCSGMFANCLALTNANLPALTTISGNNACNEMFKNCTELISVKMNKLNVITQQICPSWGKMFSYCSKLEIVELGGLTASTFASRVDQFQYLFDNTTGRDAPNGCTVHFPSNFDPADPNHTFDASTLAGYPTFGGNASYIHVAFDLPATES